MSLDLCRTYLGAASCTRGQAMRVTTDVTGTFFALPEGRFVTVRSVADPNFNIVFGGHTEQTTAAAIAPKGNLCASADASGNVKVWSVKDQPVVQFESKLFTGPATDLTWTEDGERLAAAGDANVSIAIVGVPGGNSLGTIAGHAGTIVSCDLRKKRPFKLATGDAQSVAGFHEGPPFKMKTIHQNLPHKNAINSTRFSPSGDFIATVSGGTDVVMFNGETGEKLQNFNAGHKGTIYTCSWTSDSKQIITASADKTIRVHNIADGSCAWASPAFGTAVPFMQCGAFVTKDDNFASVGLNGDITFFDKAGKQTGRWAGIAQPVAAMGFHGGKLVTVGTEGSARSWNEDGLDATNLVGSSKEALDRVTCGCVLESSVILGGAKILSYPLDGTTTATVAHSSTARFIAAVGPKSFAAVCGSKLLLFRDNAQTAEVALPKDPLSIAATASIIAIGNTDGSVNVFETDGAASLKEKGTAKLSSYGVSAVAITPDGTSIAVGDKNRFIYFFAIADMTKETMNFGQFHNSFVNGLVFNADGTELLSTGAGDFGIIRWNLESQGKTRKILTNVHHDGIKCIAFENASNCLYTAGNDRRIKVWKL